MLRTALVIIAALSLGGCLSRVQEAKDDGYCQRIGLKPGSEIYAKCRLQLRAEDKPAGGGTVVVQQQQPNPFMQEYYRNSAQIAQTPNFGANRPTSCNSTPTLSGGFSTTCY